MVRQVAYLTQPVMPMCLSKLLGASSAFPRRSVTSTLWVRGSRRAATLPPPVVVLRFRVGRQVGIEQVPAMLVDSHCHLDFPDFAEDLDAIVARAQTAGAGRIVTISTRVKQLGGISPSPAASERLLLVGTHASGR